MRAPPERTRTKEQAKRRQAVYEWLIIRHPNSKWKYDGCIRCSGTGWGTFSGEECGVCWGTGYAEAYKAIGYKPPPPPPAPDRPTRDSSRKGYPPPPHVADDPGWTSSTKEHTRREDRQPSFTTYGELPPLISFGWLFRFIDWLNAICGVEKPKNKSKEHHEQMATIAELFDDVESGVDWGDGVDRTVVAKWSKPKPPTSYGTVKK